MADDTASPRKPDRTIKSGSVQAAIWEATELDDRGRSVVRHSIRINRRYKDSGDWKSSEYYNYPSDLADLALVAQETYKYIRLSQGQEQPADVSDTSEPEAA